MKKVFAIILACALVFTAITPVFASEFADATECGYTFTLIQTTPTGHQIIVAEMDLYKEGYTDDGITDADLGLFLPDADNMNIWAVCQVHIDIVLYNLCGITSENMTDSQMLLIKTIGDTGDNWETLCNNPCIKFLPPAEASEVATFSINTWETFLAKLITLIVRVFA